MCTPSRRSIEKNTASGSMGFTARPTAMWRGNSRRSSTGRDLRVISCHLGGSSSLCAIRNGRSLDTSMGFSPQAGLPNNNRNGDLDVFSVLYLMEQEGMSPVQMRELLSKKSGLLGLSGISGDMRVLKSSGAPQAKLAI